MIFLLLARMKFSAPAVLANSTIAVPFSLTLMVRTLPQAVVMALIRSKLILRGKFEIMTRLLCPPVLVMRGCCWLFIGDGTDDPIVGMLRKLLKEKFYENVKKIEFFSFFLWKHLNCILRFPEKFVKIIESKQTLRFGISRKNSWK